MSGELYRYAVDNGRGGLDVVATYAYPLADVIAWAESAADEPHGAEIAPDAIIGHGGRVLWDRDAYHRAQLSADHETIEAWRRGAE